MTPRRSLLVAVLLAAALAPPLAAQDVRVSGDDRSPAAELVRQILARNSYVRIDRDTVLPATFRAPGDLVVYDAEVRLEGTVEGAVAVLGGHLFIRPGARIGGDVAVVGGEVYTSARATTGQVLYTQPGARVAVERDTGVVDTPGALDVEITPPRPVRLLTFLPRPFPSYDRVNGLTVALGARVLPARNDSGPRVDAWVSYRAENPDPAGGGVRVDLPLGTENLHLVAEGSRATRTNDLWLRGDLSNSISVATTGKDYRDYYDADRASLFLTRPVGKPLIAGESWLGPRVGVQWEQARALEVRDVWSLTESEQKGRPNPPVLEGTIVSAIVGTELRWQGRVSGFRGDVQLEYAVPGPSDAEFAQVVAEGRYLTTAFRTHQVEVYFRGMVPLAADSAPPQRYGILGGGGTLPTLDVGHFRGDHLAFLESLYAIPFPQIDLPYLGVPSLEVLYATGAAWVGGDVPRWIQNAGVGVAFSFVRVRVLVDPAEHPLDPKLSINLSIPQF